MPIFKPALALPHNAELQLCYSIMFTGNRIDRVRTGSVGWWACP